MEGEEYNTTKTSCCICIRTREGIYGNIWPECTGVPEEQLKETPVGSGHIFPYIPNFFPNADINSFLTTIIW